MFRLKQTLIALDQLFHAALFPDAFADETLSGRLWREREKWPNGYKIVDAIFFWDKDHCYESYVSEQKRLQLPKDYR